MIDKDIVDGKSISDHAKDGAGWVADRVVDGWNATADWVSGWFD